MQVGQFRSIHWPMLQDWAWEKGFRIMVALGLLISLPSWDLIHPFPNPPYPILPLPASCTALASPVSPRLSFCYAGEQQNIQWKGHEGTGLLAGAFGSMLNHTLLEAPVMTVSITTRGEELTLWPVSRSMELRYVLHARTLLVWILSECNELTTSRVWNIRQARCDP